MKSSMKRIYFMIVLVAALCSCSKETARPVVEEVPVTVILSTPGDVSTKTISDGLTASHLYYEVWSEDKTVRLYKGDQPLTAGQTKVELHLVKDQVQSILFWAQDPEATHYGDVMTRDLRVMTFNYTSPVSNDETRDAFYNNEILDLLVTEPLVREIELKRPFAQLNFGTTSQDIADAAKIGGMSPTESKVSLDAEVYTKLNLFTGEVSEPKKVEFQYAAIPDLSESGYLEVDLNEDGKIDDDEQYLYLSMNYILVHQTEKSDNLKVSASIKVGGQSDVVVTAANVPLKRNYRTNILGNLLTVPGKFNIHVDNAFAGDSDIFRN